MTSATTPNPSSAEEGSRTHDHPLTVFSAQEGSPTHHHPLLLFEEGSPTSPESNFCSETPSGESSGRDH